ncbi:hypothetical protein KQR56_17235 [Bacillus velezensis]|nr:hypothetical protein [Bacillus velezensis]
MDILKKIEKYREEERRLKWEGTFADYLEIIKENPLVAQSAHSRVFNMIKTAESRRMTVKDIQLFLAGAVRP